MWTQSVWAFHGLIVYPFDLFAYLYVCIWRGGMGGTRADFIHSAHT